MSTLACHLAAEWSGRGRRVLLVDTDPQATSLTWGEARAELGKDAPTVIPTGDNVRQAVSELAQNFDVVIIDTAGRQSKRLVGSLALSDVALLPCPPSGPDIWALAGSIETVAEVQEVCPKLRAGLVVNGAQRTNLSASARKAIEGFGLPVLGALGRRTVMAEAITAGEGIGERASGSIAALELRDLADAIEDLAEGKGAVDVA